MAANKPPPVRVGSFQTSATQSALPVTVQPNRNRRHFGVYKARTENFWQKTQSVRNLRQRYGAGRRVLRSAPGPQTHLARQPRSQYFHVRVPNGVERTW